MDENVTNTQKHDEHVSAHVYILYAKTKKFKKNKNENNSQPTCLFVQVNLDMI